MHAVVVAGYGLNVEVTESVYLQLECQRRLQMAVDCVFLKLMERRGRKKKHLEEQTLLSKYFKSL